MLRTSAVIIGRVSLTECVRPWVRQHEKQRDDAGEQENTEVVLELLVRVVADVVTIVVKDGRHNTKLGRRCVRHEQVSLSDSKRRHGTPGRTQTENESDSGTEHGGPQIAPLAGGIFLVVT